MEIQRACMVLGISRNVVRKLRDAITPWVWDFCKRFVPGNEFYGEGSAIGWSAQVLKYSKQN